MTPHEDGKESQTKASVGAKPQRQSKKSEKRAKTQTSSAKTNAKKSKVREKSNVAVITQKKIENTSTLMHNPRRKQPRSKFYQYSVALAFCVLGMVFFLMLCTFTANDLSENPVVIGNLFGLVGANIANVMLTLFGLGAFHFSFVCLVIGLCFFSREQYAIKVSEIIGLGLLILGSMPLLDLAFPNMAILDKLPGGVFGQWLTAKLLSFMPPPALVALGIGIALFGFLLVTDIRFKTFIVGVWRLVAGFFRALFRPFRRAAVVEEDSKMASGDASGSCREQQKSYAMSEDESQSFYYEDSPSQLLNGIANDLEDRVALSRQKESEAVARGVGDDGGENLAAEDSIEGGSENAIFEGFDDENEKNVNLIQNSKIYDENDSDFKRFIDENCEVRKSDAACLDAPQSDASMESDASEQSVESEEASESEAEIPSVAEPSSKTRVEGKTEEAKSRGANGIEDFVARIKQKNPPKPRSIRRSHSVPALEPDFEFDSILSPEQLEKSKNSDRKTAIPQKSSILANWKPRSIDRRGHVPSTMPERGESTRMADLQPASEKRLAFVESQGVDGDKLRREHLTPDAHSVGVPSGVTRDILAQLATQDFDLSLVSSEKEAGHAATLSVDSNAETDEAMACAEECEAPTVQPISAIRDAGEAEKRVVLRHENAFENALGSGASQPSKKPEGKAIRSEQSEQWRQLMAQANPDFSFQPSAQVTRLPAMRSIKNPTVSATEDLKKTRVPDRPFPDIDDADGDWDVDWDGEAFKRMDWNAMKEWHSEAKKQDDIRTKCAEALDNDDKQTREGLMTLNSDIWDECEDLDERSPFVFGDGDEAEECDEVFAAIDTLGKAAAYEGEQSEILRRNQLASSKDRDEKSDMAPKCQARRAEDSAVEPSLPSVSISGSAAKEGHLEDASFRVSEEKKIPSARELENADKQRQQENVNLDYQLPSLSLLHYEEKREKGFGLDEMQFFAQRIKEKLEEYKVYGDVINICPGPVVTRFEYLPAPGTKVAKVEGLSKDLMMALEIMSIRILAPIPGKNVIGIEIPNAKRNTIYFKEIVASEAFQSAKSRLTIALGKDSEGEPVVSDLAKMPHLLVAGTTGSGKSVGINTMICSLLYNAHPDEVKLILVDPKMLELSIYAGIPHLLVPPITTPNETAAALEWACDEMDFRYKKLASFGVRNIANYNQQLKEPTLPSAIECVKQRDENGEPVYKPMPYIVIVVDEFADLMMVAGKEIEKSIARLAQKARAAGIHIILATQRPSTNIITGVIKANFPTRLAFKVMTLTDSRVILDQRGAETLLGNGDSLFLAPNGSLTRVHGAFISDDEVQAVVSYLTSQRQPEYNFDITTPKDDEEEAPASVSHTREKLSALDELFDDAVEIVRDAGQASASLLQRRLGIGFNRSARIIEQMEREGIVGPARGQKPREVFGSKC